MVTAPSTGRFASYSLNACRHLRLTGVVQVDDDSSGNHFYISPTLNLELPRPSERLSGEPLKDR